MILPFMEVEVSLLCSSTALEEYPEPVESSQHPIVKIYFDNSLPSTSKSSHVIFSLRVFRLKLCI